MKNSKLRKVAGPQETVYWEGKPNLLCFILESIFNPMLPFAILWGAIDFGFIGAFLSDSDAKEDAPLFIIIPFFLLHLMPVWIYLFGVLGCIFRYINTDYLITNKNVYVSRGTFSYTCQITPVKQIGQTNIHQGIFDRLIGVGDVKLMEKIIQIDNGKSVNMDNLPFADKIDYQKLYEYHRTQSYSHSRYEKKRNENIISNISDFHNVNSLLQKLKDQTIEDTPQDRYGHSDDYF